MSDPPFVRLFGGPLVVAGTSRPALSPAQRRLLAIVYADAPDPVTREEVCWLLWNEGESAETRHRIRQLIYEINRPLPTPALERDGDLIVPCLPTDVNAVEPSLSPPLRLVTDAGNASFEHWLDTARARLENHRRRHFAAALDTAMQVRDPVETRVAARKLLGLTPPELTHGAVVDLAWALLTLGSYREAEDVLRAAVHQDSSLAWALDRLRSARPLSGPQGSAQEAELLGRGTTIARLAHHFYTEPGAAIVLFGPPDIGKTALLTAAETAFGLRFPTCPILRSTEDWAFGAYPFALIQELLTDRWFIEEMESRHATLPPILATAFPRVAADCGIPHPSRPVDPTPTAISRDLRRLIHELLDDRPLFIAIDDLAEADHSSLGLLADALVDPRLDVRLMATATATDAKALRSRLSALDPRLTGIPSEQLPEIAPEDSVLLIERCNPHLDPAAARQIYRAIGGVPGYLIAAATAAEHFSGLPASIQQVAEERLTTLSASDRHVCSVLAVNGEPTSIRILSAVIETPPHLLSVTVERLIDSGICRRQRGGIWFTQTFLATASHDRLTADERKGIHHSLLLAGQADPDIRSHSLHRHASAAGEPVTSVYPTLISEARNAESVGALAEASKLWSDAVIAAPDEAAEAKAVLNQVDLLLRLREYDQASIRIASALDSPLIESAAAPRLHLRQFLIRSLSDPGSISEHEVRIMLEGLTTHGTPLDMAIGLDTALRIADAKGEPSFGAELLARADASEFDDPAAATWIHLARTRHLYLGEPSRGLECARTAVLLADELGEPGLMARAINRFVVALIFRGQLASAEGSRVLSRCRALAKDFGDAVLLYDSYVNEGAWHMDIGNLHAASSCFSEAELLARSETTKVEALTTMVNRGELLLHQGRGREALELFRRAHEHSEGESTGSLLCFAGLSLASLEGGSLRKAREWASRLDSVAPSDRYRGNISLVALAKARLAQAEGQPTVALSLLLRFADDMVEWMIPAAIKLYLEAFRLALRLNHSLAPARVLGVTALVEALAIPGNGQRIVQLQDRLLQSESEAGAAIRTLRAPMS